MTKPRHLPRYVAELYEVMLTRDELTEREKAFFTDARLEDFWLKANSWIKAQDFDSQLDASESIVGVFLTPMLLHGVSGDKNNPNHKTKIIDSQHEADELIVKAIQQAKQLVDTLIKLEETGAFLQFEINILPIVRQLIPPLYDVNIASYYEGISTHKAISILKGSLEKHPKTTDIFQSVPGMKHQKSTPQDWYREAKLNFEGMLKKYPAGEFAMTQTEWTLIASILLSGELKFRGASPYS